MTLSSDPLRFNFDFDFGFLHIFDVFAFFLFHSIFALRSNPFVSLLLFVEKVAFQAITQNTTSVYIGRPVFCVTILYSYFGKTILVHILRFENAITRVHCVI